ncbi:MAG: HTTM domain-containing protein [Chitinophagales bacterium]
MAKKLTKQVQSAGFEWSSLVQLDLRSLALFRILIGASLLYNLVFVRWPYAVQMYGAHTIFPHEVLERLNGANSFSVFSIIHNDVFAHAFIAVGIVAALAIIVGVFTRWASIAGLFVFWNLCQATAFYTFGFDFYTFQLLFWSVFLPLDRYWALRPDAGRGAAPVVVNATLLVQIAWVYFSTGLAKYGGSWMDGKALTMMLMDRWATKPPANWLLPHDEICAFLTYTTLVFEIGFPLAVFDFTRKKVFRYAGVVFLIGFHLAIFAMYDVANFSLTGLAVAAVLIPESFWNTLHVQKPEVLALQQLSVNKMRALKGFVYFALFIICEKNFEFLSKHSALGDSSHKSIDDGLPSPVHISFFVQNWKMFAPNPPNLIGWWTLEGPVNGKQMDLMADKPVTNDTFPLWRPTGMEYYLAQYSRNFPYDGKGDKFRIFLKYWIGYQRKKKNLQGPISLAYYNYMVTRNTLAHPRYEKTLIPDSVFLNHIEDPSWVNFQ